ncbi:MAG: hypothetical protein HY646_18865, partial [Acidobacteria bacterium]|nr:hypothetical protein [Acidobacteriota bacterium]
MRVNPLMYGVLGLAVIGVTAASIQQTRTTEIAISNFAFAATDGVEIGATLYRPVHGGTYPAVIFGHGFGQSRFEDQGQTRGAKSTDPTSIPSEARRYAEDGYVVLAVDSRYQKLLDPKDPATTGDDVLLKPGGVAGLNNSREIQDHIEQIDWLIGDRAGMIAPARVNPERIGMSGYSYEANQTLLTAAHDPRVRAIAVLSGWTDYLTVKFPGLSGLQRGAAEFSQLAAPLVSTDFSDNDGRGNIDPAWFEAFYQATENRFDLIDTWFRKASLNWQPYRFRAAVFMAQAWNEFLIPADQATTLFERLAVPKKLYIGGWGHAPTEASADEGAYVLNLRKEFFDHWLKDEKNGSMDHVVEFAEIPWSRNKTLGRIRTEKYDRVPFDIARYRRLFLRAGERLSNEPPAGDELPDTIRRSPDRRQVELFTRMRDELRDGLNQTLLPASVSSLRALFSLGQRYAWSAELPPWHASVVYTSEPVSEDMRLLGTAYLDLFVQNRNIDPLKHNNVLSVRLMH